MKTLSFTALATIFIFAIVRADIVGPQETNYGVSNNGNVIARVNLLPNTNENDPLFPIGNERVISLYRWDSAKDTYLKAETFSIGTNSLEPHFLLIADGGNHVAAVNINSRNAGLIIYDVVSEEIRIFEFEDLFDDEMMDIIPLTGSSIQWFEKGDFDGEILQLYGPAQSIKRLSSYTLMNDPEVEKAYRISINLRTGTVEKNYAPTK